MASPRSHKCSTPPPQELLKRRRQLEERIQKLELELAGHTTCDLAHELFHNQPHDLDYLSALDDLSEDGSSLVALVNNLHQEINSAYEIKRDIEGNLEAMKYQLAEEQNIHSELREQLKLFEAEAVFAKLFHRKLALEKKKYTSISRRLNEITSQLQLVTEERDQLIKQNAAESARMQEIQDDLVALETKISQIESAVMDNRRLRDALHAAEEKAHRLEKQAQDYKGQFDASEVAKNAIELDLVTSREAAYNQKREVAELKNSLSNNQSDMATLQRKLKKQQADNEKLVKSKKLAEQKAETANKQLKSMKKELDIGKKVLNDVHTATLRTNRRVKKKAARNSGYKK